MRISREDDTDLGMVRDCWSMGAVTHDDISQWASRAIDEEVNPPTFLFTLLDTRSTRGDYVDQEIGFISGINGDDKDYDYLRQIAVRRGLEPYSYLGAASDVVLPPEREKSINDLFMHNFGIEVEKLPPLSSFKP